MSKVIFRVSKIKSWGGLVAAANHNERARATPTAGDHSRNVVIKSAGADSVATVRGIIGNATVRKNAVLAVESIISASPDYFRPADPSRAGNWDADRLAKWRAAVEPWIAARFPAAASVVLHLDEATPHYQIIDVPMDDRGRLNARGKYGGRDTLRRWQDDAAAAVAALGIERGQPGSLSEHAKVQKFYAAANQPTPAVPALDDLDDRYPHPDDDPAQPSAAARLLTPGRAAEVDAERQRRAEARHAVTVELGRRSTALAATVAPLSAKAQMADLASARAKQSAETATRLASELAERRAEADRIRALPLDQVLEKVYGAEEEPDSRPTHKTRKFVTADGRKVAVTGEKYICNTTGQGGHGAIDLVMQLDGTEFAGAVGILIQSFEQAAIASARARQLARQAEAETAKAAAAPAPVPAPAADRWPRVRDWLVKTRGIPAKTVDALHSAGLVHADGRANAVFPRENGGAFVRGTTATPFKRTFGQAKDGAYRIPGEPGAGVWLVEGPVDALAVRAMHPRATVIAVGGNLVKINEIHIDPKLGQIYAAFDKDSQGDRLAAAAVAHFGVTTERPKPPGPSKDWAGALKKTPALADRAVADPSTTAAPDKPASGSKFRPK